jgi:hypothetical protein
MTRTQRAWAAGAIGLALSMAAGWPATAADLPTPPAPAPPALPSLPSPPPPASAKEEAPAPALQPQVPAVPSAILNGRPEPAEQPGGALLGQVFESPSGGIALRPPADTRPLREIGKDEIVQFQNTDGSWKLAVTRQTFTKPTALTSGPDELGKVRPGLLQNTVELIRKENLGCQVLRQNLTNLGNNDAAIIIYRYRRNAKDLLTQTALIQANDQLYYVVSLTAPARKVNDDKVEDPGERLAADTFRAVLDSVKLLDRRAIKDDQDQRLFRTRALFYNLTARKLSSAIIPQQWRRILKETPQGMRDIGYQYIVERPDRKSNADGISVGIRTRLTPEIDKAGNVKPFPREDSESWMFTEMDRHHEDWTKQTAIDDDGKPKTSQKPWRKLTEFGSSDVRTSRILVANANDKEHPENQYKKGEIGDPTQPWVDTRSDYRLTVQYAGSKGELDPVNRSLPPFYLPQALTTMLPRLLPPNEQKTYMVATYISDAHEVMLRYYEVGAEQDVLIGGKRVRAVPITDHVGLEGTVTTHYVDARGQWLGSYNKQTKILMLPSDEQSLAVAWKIDAKDLFRIEDAEGDTANPSGAERVLPSAQQGGTGGNGGATTPPQIDPRRGTNTPAPTGNGIPRSLGGR